MSDPSMPRGQPPLKQPYSPFRGGHPQGKWPVAVFFHLGYPMPYVSDSTLVAMLYFLQKSPSFLFPSLNHFTLKNLCRKHGRMARGGYGLPTVSLGPAMPYSSRPEGGHPRNSLTAVSGTAARSVVSLQPSSTPWDTPRCTPAAGKRYKFCASFTRNSECQERIK
jgi:hypothetical protein